MRTIYKLLSEDNLVLFNNEVNKYIENGWKLYGYPQVAKSGAVTTYIQAIVLTT